MLKGPGKNTSDDENLLIRHSDQKRIMRKEERVEECDTTMHLIKI